MAFPFTSSRRAADQPAGIAARLQLPLLLLCSAVAMAANGDKSPQELLADNYVFDSSLFRGGPLSQATLSRFNRINAVAPGNYKVDLFINNRFVDRTDVRFVSVADGQVQPCLTPAQLQSAGVEADSIAGETASPEGDAACRPLDQLLKGSSSQLDMARLRLDLSVPQSLMKRVPRGYAVSEAEVRAAQRVAFARLRLVIEPGGAAALAAVLAGKVPADGRTAVVLSGGNVDPARFAAALASDG